ncbi:MAG: hypothetical protein Q4F49_05905 [Pseudoxanthomonas suwonensis]|nr:hypothetical protein [Pseudoxanthomonas suwonensis]
MPLLDADTYLDRIRLLGVLAILIAIATWAMDLADWVYTCPFCRVQRSAIGVLGVLMLLPRPGHWLVRWIASVVATLGLVVAATQNFGGWRRLSAGEFSWGEQWYIHPFLLSGFALFILMAQIMLIHGSARRAALPDRAEAPARAMPPRV